MMKNNRGFTLLEIALVLVVIGLIAGGIYGGATLINNSKLYSLARQVDQYRKLTVMFEQKYGTKPGDLERAYAIWGAACAATASECDGDGDGWITPNNGSLTDNEARRYWQHLGLAEMIPNTYSGLSSTATDYTVVGDNEPASTYASAVGITVTDNTSGTVGHTNNFDIGTPCATTGTTYGSFLNGADASQVDTKFDDGVADRGNIRGTKGCDIVAAGCQTSGSYLKTDPAITCKFSFTFTVVK